MATFERSRASLRITGDLLVPEDVTRLVGATPTTSQQKGNEILGRSTGQVRIARTGMWILEADCREPEGLERQIDEILGKLTPDLNVWTELGQKFRIDLFCGLFMQSSNDGLSLSPMHLLALGERSIELALDIYDSTD